MFSRLLLDLPERVTLEEPSGEAAKYHSSAHATAPLRFFAGRMRQCRG